MGDVEEAEETGEADIVVEVVEGGALSVVLTV